MNFTYEEKRATCKLINGIISYKRKAHPKQSKLLMDTLSTDVYISLIKNSMPIEEAYLTIRNMTEENRKAFCKITLNVISANKEEAPSFSSKAMDYVLEGTDLKQDLINYNPELNNVISMHNLLSTAKFRY